MLAVSCSRAFAASLLSAGTALDGTEVTPDLADLLELKVSAKRDLLFFFSE